MYRSSFLLSKGSLLVQLAYFTVIVGGMGGNDSFNGPGGFGNRGNMGGSGGMGNMSGSGMGNMGGGGGGGMGNMGGGNFNDVSIIVLQVTTLTTFCGSKFVVWFSCRCQ